MFKFFHEYFPFFSSLDFFFETEKVQDPELYVDISDIKTSVFLFLLLNSTSTYFRPFTATFSSALFSRRINDQHTLAAENMYKRAGLIGPISASSIT